MQRSSVPATDHVLYESLLMITEEEEEEKEEREEEKYYKAFGKRKLVATFQSKFRSKGKAQRYFKNHGVG